MMHCNRGRGLLVKKIVIVGGGAAGLELAIKLGRSIGKKKTVEILLLDKERIHFWKPHLHELAAGSIGLDGHSVDYLSLAHQHSFSFYIAEVFGLDTTKKLIQVKANLDERGNQITPECEIPYDTLVLALGSKANDFGITGVKENAISLDNFEDAIFFQKKLVNAFLKANSLKSQNKTLGKEQLQVAIVGAGATGVELAAELRNAMKILVAYGYTALGENTQLGITLIEANERILSSLPERVSDTIKKILGKRNVRILEGAKVSEVSGMGVTVNGNEFIPAELVVWAAGIKCPDFFDKCDLETNEINQVIANEKLCSVSDENVFVIGDCGSVPWIGGPARKVPPRAQAASQQAKYLSVEIPNILEGEPSRKWIYKDFGSLVSLGKYSTVGSLMAGFSKKGFFLEGFFAKLMYIMLYKFHEYALFGFFKTLFVNIGRGFSSQIKSRVKLH